MMKFAIVENKYFTTYVENTHLHTRDLIRMVQVVHIKLTDNLASVVYRNNLHISRHIICLILH